MMKIATALLLSSLGLVGCGGSDPPEPQPSPEGSGSVKVEVAQVYSPEIPYGIEGSAAFVTFEQESDRVAAVGPVPSKPDDNQPLVEIELEPGHYEVRAHQLPCGPAGCDSALPGTDRLPRNGLTCDGALEAGDPAPVADVVVVVNPERGDCRIETGFVERG